MHGLDRCQACDRLTVAGDRHFLASLAPPIEQLAELVLYLKGSDIDGRRSSATCDAVRYFNGFDRRDADARVIRPLLDRASPVEASGSSLSHAPVAKPRRAFAAHADWRLHKSGIPDLRFSRCRKSDKSDLAFLRWRKSDIPDLR